MTTLPGKLAAVPNLPDWRSGFFWPIAYADLRARQSQQSDLSLQLIAGLADERLRITAIQAVARASATVREFGHRAWLAEAAEAQGAVILGAGLDGAAVAAAPAKATSSRYDQRISRPLARRLARVASWSATPGRLVQALIAPDAVAISHNGLLRSEAALGSEAIGYRHAETIAAQALKRGRADAGRVSFLTDALVALLDRYPVDTGRVAPLRNAACAEIATTVERADRLLDGLSGMQLPRALWANSAGNFSVRACLLEARRRGIPTAIFDHGGSGSFIDEAALLLLVDRIVAERVVAPTEAAANLSNRLSYGDEYRSLRPARIVGGGGDPLFRKAARTAPRTRRARPRVLYLPTCFNGGLQNLPPLLPDPVYLHQHFAVLESFRDASVEFAVKPHPESKLSGLPHPLTGLAELDTRPFPQALADADVIISDYPQSTAFWEACCSDRAVVVLDLGIVRFHAAAQQILDRRCRFVDVRWDERNLPCFDAAELAEVTLIGAAGDPAEIRNLLAGEE